MAMLSKLAAADLQQLHNAGISKSTEHAFVYRYPDSDSMPVMSIPEFASDLKRNSKKERQLAFYLHVPFCTAICDYCHYFKQLSGNEKQVQAYLASIEKEIAAYRNLIDAKVGVNSVFFGGGTPTTLQAGQLNELMLFLQQLFPMPKKVEASVESSPETLSLKKLTALRQNFNRLSIGVQDFDNAVLKECNRNHDRKQAVQAIKDARDAGFDDINIDLIYGLPLQGVEGWGKTLAEIEALQPESVTASDLRIQKSALFFLQSRELFAPEQQLIEMHSMFLDKMFGLGYKQIFPYQFVKPGKGMLFLQNQWQNNEFLGFGPSSCSYLNEWDYNNVFPTGRYVEQVDATGLACAVGKKLSTKEQMCRHVALGLKNSGLGGVDKRLFRKRFGLSLDEQFGSVIELLEGLCLVESNGKALRLSQTGLIFYDSVSRKFFPKKQD